METGEISDYETSTVSTFFREKPPTPLLKPAAAPHFRLCAFFPLSMKFKGPRGITHEIASAEMMCMFG